MLGSIKAGSLWEWSAIGKHPVAMDYFQLGARTPLVNAFGAWIENGYQKVISSTQNRLASHSWRFWARGIQKGYIACGVARDSSDSTGRPYPLLIMGTGKIPGWEKNWDLLSSLFDEIWNQIEYLASRRFTDLMQLEFEISRIQVTAEDWAGCPDHMPEEKGYPYISRDIQKATEALLTRNECYISINSERESETALVAKYWNCAVKSRIDIVPNAVFMGGIPEKSYLTIFTRSLTSSDFAQLWSVSIEDQSAM
jgi:type VI secretion system ImpM family protein